MRGKTGKRHLSDQMLEAIVDEYEQYDLLAERNDYSADTLARLEGITKRGGERLKAAITKRMSA